MKRVKDYASFAVWFIGASYIVWWLAIARGYGGALSSCDVPPLSAVTCGLPASPSSAVLHELFLHGFVLHALGLAAVVFVLVRLALTALKRVRGQIALARRDPFSIAAWRIRMRIRPISRNTPRREFGLRGSSR